MFGPRCFEISVFLIFSGPTDCHGTKLRFTICSLDIFAFQVIHQTRREVFDLEKKQLQERLKNEAKGRFLKRSWRCMFDVSIKPYHEWLMCIFKRGNILGENRGKSSLKLCICLIVVYENTPRL